MSTILEQAIVDAEALKEVALKNAEATILEKYSDKIKEAVETLLEQDEGLETQQEAISIEVADQIPLAATDGENACPCPDQDEEVEVTIDFDELRKDMGDEDEEVSPLETSEEAAEEMMALEEEKKMPMKTDTEDADDDGETDDKVPAFLKKGETIDEEAVLNLEMFDTGSAGDEVGGSTSDEKKDQQRAKKERDAANEELNLEDLDLEAIVEKLTVDIVPQKSGWAGDPSPTEYEFAEKELLALNQDTEVKEELAAMRKAVKSLQEDKKTLRLKNTALKTKLNEVTGIFGSLKENIAETSVMNAKLLYTNKVLGDASLNERQKDKLVESISKADSVEEAKVVYETLLSTVGSAPRKQPKSLSEAVNKTTSTLLLSRKKEDKKYDPSTERWRILAGLNKK
tara:strand:+ start:11328 stop:12527 length:1200 start_codon:yes stop_codon:yes gene_type:complete